MNRNVILVALACLLPASFGCGDSTKVQPTATGSTLGSSAPKTAGAKKFKIDSNESMVKFLMDAPAEKIRGRIAGGTSGELFIDITDLTQTTGTIVADLDKLELFQRKKEEGDADYGSEIKSEKQNEHAKAWLELGVNDKVTKDQRDKNARCEFKITSIVSASEKDITKMTGPERKVQVKAKGTLLLHAHQEENKEVDLEVTFKVDGDKVTGVRIAQKSPINVELKTFVIEPKDALGGVIQSGFSLFGKKVANTAPIELDISAKPEGMALSTTPPPPDPTPVVSAPPSSGSAAASAAPSASAAAK